MRSSIKTLALSALAALLCACATTPPSTSYNKAASKIRGIALQPPGFPEHPSVQTLDGGGMSFSFPGMSKNDERAAGEAEAAKELQDIFVKTDYDYKKDVRDALQNAFAKSGVPTITVRGERPLKDRSRLTNQCPPVPGADACLDVIVTFVGFTAANATTEYVPTVELTAKLVRIADNATLFQNQIIYNAAAGTQGIPALPSGRYRFRDRAAMQANPQAVSTAVKEAMQSVAITLATQFQ